MDFNTPATQKITIPREEYREKKMGTECIWGSQRQPYSQLQSLKKLYWIDCSKIIDNRKWKANHIRPATSLCAFIFCQFYVFFIDHIIVRDSFRNSTNQIIFNSDKNKINTIPNDNQPETIVLMIWFMISICTLVVHETVCAAMSDVNGIAEFSLMMQFAYRFYFSDFWAWH